MTITPEMISAAQAIDNNKYGVEAMYLKAVIEAALAAAPTPLVTEFKPEDFDVPNPEYLADMLDDHAIPDYPYATRLMQEAAKLIRQLQGQTEQEYEFSDKISEKLNSGKDGFFDKTLFHDTPAQENDFKYDSFLTNCILHVRPGDSPLFIEAVGKILSRLDRYSITPIEQSDELREAAEEAQRWLMALALVETSGVDRQTKVDISACSDRLRVALEKAK